MKFSDLLEGIVVQSVSGDPAIEINSIHADSRNCRPGSLFVAIPGLALDGATFIDEAIRKGAAALISEREGPASLATAVVADARTALALAAANFYGRPAGKLSIIGVTGTSGKTTTTKMIESIIDATDTPAGLIGTIEYRAGEMRELADRTTPDAIVLQQWFERMADAGVRYAVMEVSSHALALERTHGVAFASAVFTNLSRDHFDFHSDFEDYFQAKRRLFDQVDRSKRCAIINLDDEYGARLANELGRTAITFGIDSDAEIRPARKFSISVEGLHGAVETPFGEVRLESALLGRPNLANWLAAIGATLAVGIPIETVERGIRALEAVRGRFERVDSDDATVLVDYAHKPDALEKLLHAVRDLAPGRKIILVFGCGGDRDQGKRPIMGEIAGKLADQTIITSDNPRRERPETIIAQIEQGIRRIRNADYLTISDRRAAIEKAISGASPDAIVVIAGKGHENYQVVGDRILHFDDREEAEIALGKRFNKA